MMTPETITKSIRKARRNSAAGPLARRRVRFLRRLRDRLIIKAAQ